MSERIQNLEQEVARHKEDSGKAQAEVDRLLEILREMENEKNDKDKKINELERWVDPRRASRVNLYEFIVTMIYLIYFFIQLSLWYLNPSYAVFIFGRKQLW